jgi:hypothetical protein
VLRRISNWQQSFNSLGRPAGGGYTSFDFGNEFDAQVLPITFVPCQIPNEACAILRRGPLRRAAAHHQVTL